jgi:Uma2 family endonuclease
VIEVVDTSVDRDRAKAAIYRSAGVEEYWIINISERSIERYHFAEGLQSDQPSILPADSRITLDISDAVMVLDLDTLWNAE